MAYNINVGDKKYIKKRTLSLFKESDLRKKKLAGEDMGEGRRQDKDGPTRRLYLKGHTRLRFRKVF